MHISDLRFHWDVHSTLWNSTGLNSSATLIQPFRYHFSLHCVTKVIPINFSHSNAYIQNTYIFYIYFLYICIYKCLTSEKLLEQ